MKTLRSRPRLRAPLTEAAQIDKPAAMQVSPFSLIIFDCDGVLIDSEIISARMLIAALAERGVTIDLGYVARHFLGRSYPVVMQTIRQDFGLDLPARFEDDYREQLFEGFRQGLKVIPHVREVLEALSCDWCVATSSSRPRAAMSLNLVGLWPLVQDRLFTASEVQRGKPAPDLFLHAAAQRGTPPSQALVIEDSLTGIEAAIKAGMQVWRFTGGSHMQEVPSEPSHARPQLRFASFDQFFQIAPVLRRRS